jgi:hypothetical protein
MHVHTLSLLQKLIQHVVIGLYTDSTRLHYLFDQSLLALSKLMVGYMSSLESSSSQFR